MNFKSIYQLDIRFSVLIVFIVVCVISTIAAENSANAASWNGTWQTNWSGGGARMQILQSGNQVNGTYTHRNGRITGTVTGNRLTGSWFQDNGSGSFTFIMSHDDMSFTGRYDNGQAWNGKRLQKHSYWTGTWDTTWKGGSATMTLIQRGDQVSGNYNHQGGRITGRVNDNRLVGQWSQSNGRGTFHFVMTRDGRTFSGTYDNGQSWHGKKIR